MISTGGSSRRSSFKRFSSLLFPGIKFVNWLKPLKPTTKYLRLVISCVARSRGQGRQRRKNLLWAYKSFSPCLVGLQSTFLHWNQIPFNSGISLRRLSNSLNYLLSTISLVFVQFQRENFATYKLFQASGERKKKAKLEVWVPILFPPKGPPQLHQMSLHSVTVSESKDEFCKTNDNSLFKTKKSDSLKMTYMFTTDTSYPIFALTIRPYWIIISIHFLLFEISLSHLKECCFYMYQNSSCIKILSYLLLACGHCKFWIIFSGNLIHI